MQKKTSQTNAEKGANLPDKIFNYIYIAKCKRLFLLTWYDNEIYTSSSMSLPTLYYNILNFNSEDCKYL